MAESIDLKFNVSAITIDKSQFKQIGTLVGYLRDLQKTATAVNKQFANMSSNISNIGTSAKSISTNFDKIGASAKTADSGIKNLATNTDALSQSAKSAATSYANIGKSAQQAAAATAAASSQTTTPTVSGSLQKTGVQSAIAFNQVYTSITLATGALNQFLQPYVELDKEIKNIGTLGRENFEEFTQYAGQLAAEIPGQANDAAKAYYQIISALGTRASQFTNQQIAEIGKLAAQAAVAGQSTTTAAADIATSILNAWQLEASDTAAVFDTLFGAVKLGKTSFEEIAQALPSFAGAASQAGVGLDQVTSALSSLTSVGIPTAQAGTQLQAVFTLLSKGNDNLEKSLAQSGLTLQDLRDKMALPVEEGGGLVNVMNLMRTSVEATGETFGAKFTGRVEAANAILGLTGKNLENTVATYNAMQDEIAGNAAAEAFGVAAGSISAQTDSIISTIQNQFNNLFSTIGSGATTALSSFVQLAPAITGLSSALAIVPVKGIFSSGFVTTTLPKLLAGVIALIPGFGGVATAETAAGVAGKVAWKAILGPIGLIITGIGLLIGLIVLIIKYFDEIKAVGAGIWEGIKAAFGGIIDIFKDLFKAIKEGDIKGIIIGVFKSIMLATPIGFGIQLAQKFFNGFKKGFDDSLSQNEDVVQERIEDTFKDLDAIEVKIDASKDLDKLITDYQSTTNEINQLKAKPDLTSDELEQLDALEKKAQSMANKIAEIDPAAITSTKTVIDENGKLVDSYEVSIDKAAEFADKQRELNDTQKDSTLKEYNKNANDLLNIYNKQTKEIESLVKEREKLLQQGDTKGAAKLEEEITEKTKVQAENKGKLLNLYKESVAVGGKDLETNKKIQSQFQITEDTVNQIASGQADVNDQLEETQSLSELFASNMSAAKDAQSQAVNKLAALYKQQAEGNTVTEEGLDIQEAINKAAKDGLQAKKDVVAYTDAIKKAEKELGINQKKSTKEGKTYYQQLDDVYKLEKDRIAYALKQYEIDSETTRLSANRNKNSLDDLDLNKKKIAALKEEQQFLQKNFDITADGTAVGVKIKAEDKTKVLEQYNALRQAIQQEENKSKEIEIKFDADLDKINKAVQDQLKSDIEFNIEIGKADKTDLLKFLQNEISGLETEIIDYENKISEATIANDDKVKQSYIEAKNEIIAAANDKRKEIIKLEREISNDTFIEIEKRIAAEKAAKEAQLDLDIQEAKKRTELFGNTYTAALQQASDERISIIENEESSKLDAIDTAEENKLSLLETQKENGIITEKYYQSQLTSIQSAAEEERLAMQEEYEKKKAAAAEKAAREAIINEGLQQGALIQIETDALKKKQELQLQEAYDNMIALQANKAASEAEINAAITKYDTLKAETEKRMSFLQQYSTAIGDGINETVANLFAGNTKAAKDGIKETLSILAGGLERMASAAATELILGQLGILGATTGIAGLLLVPTITASVQGAIRALIRPVLSGLLSFSGGGEINSPTMAVIGDAKSTTGSNTEWVFNSKNLRQYSAMVANDYTKAIAKQNNTAKLFKQMQNSVSAINSKNFRDIIKADANRSNDNNSMLYKEISQMRLDNSEMKQILLDANKQRDINNDYINTTNRILVKKDMSPIINTNISYNKARKPRKIH